MQHIFILACVGQVIADSNRTALRVITGFLFLIIQHKKYATISVFQVSLFLLTLYPGMQPLLCVVLCLAANRRYLMHVG